MHRSDWELEQHIGYMRGQAEARAEQTRLLDLASSLGVEPPSFAARLRSVGRRVAGWWPDPQRSGGRGQGQPGPAPLPRERAA